MEWINVEERMPEVIWTEHEDGKKYWSPQVVLIHAVFTLKDGSTFPAIASGEYDNTGIPEKWKTCLDYFDNECPFNGLDFRSVTMKKVTHWMPLPPPPFLPVYYDEISEMPSDVLEKVKH